MANHTGGNPNVMFTRVYGPAGNLPTIETWRVRPSAMTQEPVSAQFAIPQDLDTASPITLEIHFFINKITGSSGTAANVQINADYAATSQEIGTTAPATGFKETVTSGNFTITEPTGSTPPQQNLMHIVTSVPLNGALMVGNNWGFVSLTRIATIAPDIEYDRDIYIVMFSFKYTRLCSS